MNLKSLPIQFGSLSLFVFLSGNALCLPNDKTQPTQFSSDSQTLNLKDGLVTWLGSAKFSQGSLEIEADKIVVTLDKNQKPTHMIATGAPAHFKQQPEADKAVIHGEALAVTYDVKTEIVTLEKNAQVEQDGATTRGAQFDYDIKSSNLKASGGVTTVIPPKADAK